MHWSEVTKNVILSIGIFIGGGWSLYVFHTTFKTEHAAAELAFKQRQLIDRPALTSKLDFKILKNKDDKWVVTARVEITNTGNDNGILILGKDTFIIGEIKFSKNGTIERYDNILFSEARDLPGITDENKHSKTNVIHVLVGQTKTLTDSFLINHPGIYKLQFNATPGSKTVKIRKSSKDSKDQKNKQKFSIDKVFEIKRKNQRN